MLIRLPLPILHDLRSRAAACGMDLSEVARRAIRRHRVAACSTTQILVGATRRESTPVHLDLGPLVAGMTPAEIRAVLAEQLEATAAAVRPAPSFPSGEYVEVPL